MLKKQGFKLIAVFILFFLVATANSATAEKKALTFQDIMNFRQIQNPKISADGLWVAYAVKPDRGDGAVVVRSVQDGKEYVIERGAGPKIAGTGYWVAAAVKPPAAESAGSKKPKPQPGMALLDTRTGEILQFEKVQKFAFSEDSRWLAYHLFKEEKKPEKEGKKASEEKNGKKPKVGTTLILVNIETGEEIQIPFVLEFAFDGPSHYLAYALAGEAGKDNGLYFIELSQQGWSRKILVQQDMLLCSALTWTKEGSRLAFLAADMNEGSDLDRDAVLWLWKGGNNKPFAAVAASSISSDWFLPEKNRLRWSKDGKRLFLGLKPEEFRQTEAEKKDTEEKIDPFDVAKILEKSEVDVWHWNDPLINPNQKKNWSRTKAKTYSAVYHVDSRRLVQLADRGLPDMRINENPNYALGVSGLPYQQEMTWYGQVNDLYIVNLKNGSRNKIASRLESRASISPGGRYVVYYADKHWHLFDRRSGKIRNLTKGLAVPFFDEDHDYPSKVPSYGTAGWVGNDQAVLIYDKYDIWKFPLRSGAPVNVTNGKGREELYTFRIVRTDTEQQFFNPAEKLLLTAYHNKTKNWGFYECGLSNTGTGPLLEEQKKFKFIAKAEKADTVLYSREAYDEFPDLWVSDTGFTAPQKISDVNPQKADFAWGSAELVAWESLDGYPLQGILIKPGNYEEGKRYPVLVYYYRFFSQRLYEFNQMVINHRPNFPFYASNGYAVFLPDIRFDVGHPGYSATKCLVPGIQKIIESGVADPEAIGLHGHSWSGYQTAHVITQTNIFTCAVAGAPVSNMTSAYSGIRWGTGLARQFQYEQSQSRIGGSLWEKRDLYIENSPVFFADRIQTPLLIIFGDEDGAVPWYQGIELYLAMRRLKKDCVFLQYRGEPHHPQKYPNKLDWFKKMKEYFDHYLKGAPGPDWITKGIPYKGK